MKLPIPQDWDGESWQCLQIQWPKSPAYRAILLGFLSYLTRGRAWDERIGLVTDAQDVGWAIFNKNYPLKACENGEDTGTRGPGFWPCESSYDEVEECEDNMSGCAGSGLPIKIEDGKLYWWACCQWNLVGPISTPVEDFPDGTEEPDHDPDEGVDRCKKATHVVNVLWEMSRIIYEHAGTTYEGEVQNLLKAAYPMFDYSLAYLILATPVYVPLRLGGPFDDSFTAIAKQRLICKWAEVVKGDSWEISASERDKMGVACFAAMGADEAAAMNGTLAVLGADDLRKLGLQAGTMGSGLDCSCPDYIEPADDLPGNPGGLEWQHDFKFVLEDYGFTGDAGLEYTLGQGFHGNTDSVVYTVEMVGGLAVADTVQYMYVELKVPAGFQWEDQPNAFHYKIGSNAELLWADLGDTVISGGGTLKIWKRPTNGQHIVDKFVRVAGEGSIPVYPNQVYLRRVMFGGSGVDPWPDAPDKI